MRPLLLVVSVSGAVALSGCSSSKAASTSATCSTPDGLTIAFSPMYSAIIPNDTTHTFSIPAIVNGASPNDVSWHVSDTSAVSITPDAVTGGVLLTMLPTARSPGTPVTVTAATKTACGTATLNITVGSDSDWSTGESRYYDKVVVDAGSRAACADCHAPNGDAGAQYDDIAHTPEQAGGFSDQQLLDIIQNGQIPDGGYFDPNIVPYKTWQTFHAWNLTTAEQTGIVIYLRSLVPTPQMGTANFGGSGG